MKVYQYKKCSTCVKALKFLDKKKLSYDSLDITEKAPSKSELKFMLDKYEGDIKRLFNTSGVLYRELNIKEQLPKMSTAQAIDLLSKHGKLVKRPFVIKGKTGLIGFKEEEWKKAFK